MSTTVLASHRDRKRLWSHQFAPEPLWYKKTHWIHDFTPIKNNYCYIIIVRSGYAYKTICDSGPPLTNSYGQDGKWCLMRKSITTRLYLQYGCLKTLREVHILVFSRLYKLLFTPPVHVSAFAKVEYTIFNDLRTRFSGNVTNHYGFR